MPSILKIMTDQELSDWVAANSGYMRVLEQILRVMDRNTHSKTALLTGVLEQAVEYMDAIHEDREPKVRTKDIDELSTTIFSLQRISTCEECGYCRAEAIKALRMIGKK